MQGLAPWLDVPGAVGSVKFISVFAVLGMLQNLPFSLPFIPLSQCVEEKVPSYFFARFTKVRKVNKKKKLLGDFEEMHLTLLPYRKPNALATLEQHRDHPHCRTKKNGARLIVFKSALSLLFFPHPGNNQFEQDGLSKSLRFLTA